MDLIPVDRVQRVMEETPSKPSGSCSARQELSKSSLGTANGFRDTSMQPAEDSRLNRSFARFVTKFVSDM